MYTRVNAASNRVPFAEIWAGTTFQYYGKLYLKTAVESNIKYPSNHGDAYCIQTRQTKAFCDRSNVIPLNAISELV